MRTAFIQQLMSEAKRDERVFLLVGDLGYSVVEPFAESFPDRFLNIGVAEQNMAGIAAGLAKEGYIPFIYSIGNFPTLRCLEQIRYDICYHALGVKIVSVGGGFAYGALGASHHGTEDLGILRTLPGMIVTAPGDPQETRLITTHAVQTDAPMYIRLGKAGEPAVHPGNIVFAAGKMIPVCHGKNTVVLTTGAMLRYASDFIRHNNLLWGLYSVPYIKPIDSTTIELLAHSYERIITLEEHQRSAGLGSAVLEALHDCREKKKSMPIPFVHRIAIPDQFIQNAGSQDYLRQSCGLVLSEYI